MWFARRCLYNCCGTITRRCGSSSIVDCISFRTQRNAPAFSNPSDVRSALRASRQIAAPREMRHSEGVRNAGMCVCGTFGLKYVIDNDPVRCRTITGRPRLVKTWGREVVYAVPRGRARLVPTRGCVGRLIHLHSRYVRACLHNCRSRQTL